MSLLVKPFTFSAGATVIAAEHNSNFDTIYTDYNGSIDNTNLAAGAAIVDTKLATISTANKVIGAALCSFSNVTAAAGIFPYANLPASYTGTYVASSTQPNVANTRFMYIANLTATTIQGFSGGVDGQELTLAFADTGTSINRVTCVLAASATFKSAQYATLKLVYYGATWYELSRITNNG